jgi:hypothetical protein
MYVWPPFDYSLFVFLSSIFLSLLRSQIVMLFSCVVYLKVKVKVNFTLEQATNVQKRIGS